MENGIIFFLKLKRKTQNSKKKLNVSEDLSSPTLPSDVKKRTWVYMDSAWYDNNNLIIESEWAIWLERWKDVFAEAISFYILTPLQCKVEGRNLWALTKKEGAICCAFSFRLIDCWNRRICGGLWVYKILPHFGRIFCSRGNSPIKS